MNSELLASYEKIKLVLESAGFITSKLKEISYGLQFQVAFEGSNGLVRMYQNKKGVQRIDYSQIKDDALQYQIQSTIEINSPYKSVEASSSEPNRATSYVGFPVIGTDESGKGDYFGPLVSAGVYVSEETAPRLAALGVTDSKVLSDAKNQEVALKIMRICHDHFVVIELLPEKYNELYKQFAKEKQNLNALLAWGHAKAIEEVLERVDCDVAVADQFANERYILSKLQEKGRQLKLIQMPKAESNIAVATASILARARFLKRLKLLSEQFDIELPKGASQTTISQAKLFVEKYGEESLHKVAKLHFKTTKSVLEG